MVNVSAWGRLSADPHQVHPVLDSEHPFPVSGHGERPGLGFGMGRSYGDVCLNPAGVLWSTSGLDRYISWDPASGRLRCESGVLLRDIQRLMIPRGWSLPVTPGTQYVTVGGAVANDVHGKNHHAFGTFGDHVERLRLVRSDGQVVDCGRDTRRDWLEATVGGLGLTGLIVEADLQLRPVSGPWLDTETIPYGSLDEFFGLSDDSEASWEHTVSWIDCISGSGQRGIFLRGRWAPESARREPRMRRIAVPVVPPWSLVNHYTLRAFNTVYFNLGRLRRGRRVTHYQPFFYPLDNILEWNRIYGPRGFFQYQCVVPRASGAVAVALMMQEIARSGEGSFLAILKTFGNKYPIGLMSFPMPGVTLALDFPNAGVRTEALFRRLDGIVHGAGGRVYLAKDARLRREDFEASYPGLRAFLKYRDPGISSSLSRRLMGS